MPPARWDGATSGRWPQESAPTSRCGRFPSPSSWHTSSAGSAPRQYSSTEFNGPVTETWQLTGSDLTVEKLASFEESRPKMTLNEAARRRVQASRDTVAAAVKDGRVSYGITTGFGAFANRQIPAAKVKELQLNLVRSHSCGVGEPLPDAIVRRILLLKEIGR